MASGNRASMREGPLAQLFRKTEDDAQQGDENRKPEQEPKVGRPLPKDGPAPQATRQVPEPQGQEERQRSAPPQRNQAERMTEAARRADDREARRREREQRWSRYEGVPSPEDRLRSVFSSDIPENILEHAPEQQPP